ncbi:hypothetical protein P152DRAFT_383346, partial [Eremomyces bilateralis CBS 781.70]
AIPRIARPSFWQSLIPKPFRRGEQPPSAKGRTADGWLFFIIMPLLIGSQAIQLITLKKEMAAYSRQTKGKIALLKEVIGRIQKGEQFDVGKALGGGDPIPEEEWKETMEEVKSGPLFSEKDRRPPWTKRETKAEKPEKTEEP